MAAIGNIPLILHLKAEKINHFHEQLSALSRFWSPVHMLVLFVLILIAAQLFHQAINKHVVYYTFISL
jgi:hypothetical protein